MADERVLNALARGPHFQSLPSELRSRLAEGCRWTKLAPGESLFLQGEPARGFFVVEFGAIRLYRLAPDGRELAIQTAPRGASFAEAAVLSIGTFPANARALDEGAELLEIGAATFLQLFRDDPRVAAAMVASLSSWLHALVDRVEELQIASAPTRFARFMLRLPARDEAQALVVSLPMSKKELAAHLAIAPETLSRLLRRWQDQRLIEARGRDLAILDARVLTAIADQDDELRVPSA